MCCSIHTYTCIYFSRFHWCLYNSIIAVNLSSACCLHPDLSWPFDRKSFLSMDSVELYYEIDTVHVYGIKTENNLYDIDRVPALVASIFRKNSDTGAWKFRRKSQSRKQLLGIRFAGSFLSHYRLPITICFCSLHSLSGVNSSFPRNYW